MKIINLITTAMLTFCLTGNVLSTSTKITVVNETLKTLVLYFDSMIYKRPQTEMLIPKQTRSVYLDDYTNKDITKNITIEARGATLQPVIWSFAQTNLRDNMTLIFSITKSQTLKLTIIKPDGRTKVVDPISK